MWDVEQICERHVWVRVVPPLAVVDEERARASRILHLCHDVEVLALFGVSPYPRTNVDWYRRPAKGQDGSDRRGITRAHGGLVRQESQRAGDEELRVDVRGVVENVDDAQHVRHVDVQTWTRRDHVLEPDVLVLHGDPMPKFWHARVENEFSAVRRVGDDGSPLPPARALCVVDREQHRTPVRHC